jgi:hypothetical protein
MVIEDVAFLKKKNICNAGRMTMSFLKLLGTRKQYLSSLQMP